MKEFKKPNVKAPRFRPSFYNVLNKEFFEKFKKKYPKYKNLDNSILKKIVKTFNETISSKVIENRDGIELPQQLGWIFIGTCASTIRVDFHWDLSKK